MLMNILHSPAKGSFCDEHGNNLKPAMIQNYNKYIWYVDKSDHMM